MHYMHVCLCPQSCFVCLSVCALLNTYSTLTYLLYTYSNSTKYSLNVLGGFPRNSRKYWLESLRKTPTEETPSTGLVPTCGQLALCLQPTNQPIKCLEIEIFYSYLT